MRVRSMSRGLLVAGVLLAAAGCATGATFGTDGGDGGNGGDGGAGGNGGSNQGGMGHGGQPPTTTTTTTVTTTTTTTTTSSSSSSSSSISSSSSSGQGGGSSVCDGTGDCNTCASCSVEDICYFEYLICSSDFECIDFESCLLACPENDQLCVDDCVAYYPYGAQEYSDLLTCIVCVACYNDCDGSGSGC